jgi:ribosomal protein L7/L12
MGAWGSGSFENDDASDWIADFCDEPDKELISDALSTVAEMEADEYLEAPDCSVGIAAAEVVAALKGAASPGLSDDATECVAKLKLKADPRTASLALKAVQRIKTNSELKELWDESENPNEWYAAIDNLETRLKN